MGHDGFLQAIHQYELMPRDLPTDFPRAIRQVLLTEFPSSEQPLIDVAMDVVHLGVASVELRRLALILRQRMDRLVLEASHQEVAQVSWPGVTTHQAGCLFTAGIMRSIYHLADSDLTMLQLETAPHWGQTPIYPAGTLRVF